MFPLSEWPSFSLLLRFLFSLLTSITNLHLRERRTHMEPFLRSAASRNRRPFSGLARDSFMDFTQGTPCRTPGGQYESSDMCWTPPGSGSVPPPPHDEVGHRQHVHAEERSKVLTMTLLISTGKVAQLSQLVVLPSPRSCSWSLSNRF